MEFLKYTKMQIGFLILLIYVSYLFVKDGSRLNQKSKAKKCNPFFDRLFVFGEAEIALDCITVYTVNHLDRVPGWLNTSAHLAYLLCYQLFIFIHSNFLMCEV